MGVPMSIIERIEQQLQEQEIDGVYELYHQFFDEFDTYYENGEVEDIIDYSIYIGFYEEAKKALLLLLEREPEESIWTIQLAELYTIEGEYDQALSILYDIPDTDPNYVGVLVVQAELYRQQGYMDVAERKLMQAKEYRPKEIEIDFYLGQLLFEAEQFERSKLFLEKYIQAEGRFLYEAQQLLLDMYIIQDDYMHVMELLEDLEEDELETERLYHLAALHYEHDELDRALQVYSTLMLRDPDSPSLYLGLAKIHYLQKEYHKAYESVQEVLERDPYRADAYELQAYIFRQLNNVPAAIECMEQVLELQPEQTRAGLFLYELYMEIDESEEAVKLLVDLVEGPSFTPEYYYLLAQGLNQQEEYERAGEYFELASQYYNESTEFIEAYVQFLREDGQIEAAKEWINKGLEIAPLNRTLNDIYQQMGDLF